MTSKSLSDAVFLVLDCQTSGATPKHGPMIEVSWVFMRGAFALSSARSFLIKPPEGFSLPKNITRLTGLSNEDLQAGVGVADVKTSLDRDIAAHVPEFAVAHFARFEALFFADLYGTKGFPLSFFCTHALSKRLVADLPSYSIRALAAYFGYETAELKRSAHHVEATIAIWRGLSGLFAGRCLVDAEGLRQCLAQAPLQKGDAKQYFIPRQKRLMLAAGPGVYRFLSSQGDVLYVGKATSLRSRVNSYFRGRKSKGSRLAELLTRAKDVEVTEVPSPLEAALYENHLIKTLRPTYNEALKRSEQAPVWTDRSFWALDVQDSSACSVGPFPSLALFDAMHGVYRALYDELPAPLLPNLGTVEIAEQAINLLRIEWAHQLSKGVSLRGMIALALVQIRAAEKVGSEGIDDEDGCDEGDAFNAEEASDDSSDEPFVLTPEVVARAYKKLFSNFARLYLRSKALKALKSATVFYKSSKASKGWRMITIDDGRVGSLARLATRRSIRNAVIEESPLESLSLGYDGLRILWTELRQLQRKGGRFIVTSRIASSEGYSSE